MNDPKGGRNAALIENDHQIGAVNQSQISDESMLRKRKELEISLSDEDDDEDYREIEKRSFKTSLSDKMLMDVSFLYSKSLYPVSLGHMDDDNLWNFNTHINS